MCLSNDIMSVQSLEEQNKEKFMELEKLVSPLNLHLEKLNQFLKDQISFFEPELQALVSYSLAHKGKRIRPMLVFFSGWQNSEYVSSDLIKLAGVIELVHLATLVHDDILDEAVIRHNMPTICKKHGNKIAVLLGDALFSHALILASEFEFGNVCHTISQSIRRVCAGEIKQTFQASEPTYGLTDYYRIIDLKTAELFYVSCLLGARLARFPDDYVEAVASFGREMGIAYQIYDDLADILGDEKSIGKTLGTDFAHGKHTLLTLKLLEKLAEAERLNLYNKIQAQTIQLKDFSDMLFNYGIYEEAFVLLNEKIKNAGKFIEPFKSMPSYPYLLGMRDLILAQVDRIQKGLK